MNPSIWFRRRMDSKRWIIFSILMILYLRARVESVAIDVGKDGPDQEISQNQYRYIKNNAPMKGNI